VVSCVVSQTSEPDGVVRGEQACTFGKSQRIAGKTVADGALGVFIGIENDRGLPRGDVRGGDVRDHRRRTIHRGGIGF